MLCLNIHCDIILCELQSVIKVASLGAQICSLSYRIPCSLVKEWLKIGKNIAWWEHSIF